ncbi:HAMP domain-containing histidine kinase [Nostoc sp. C057]|jgi:signal transduction histidine kinase|uniref:HAMP domain-containing histidine kinase n=1 Tax=Nostoc sp. C057 TaxID=2576903 RepID=UPI0015C3418C|nr:HAMP domain-containing histidine kinase [Nostoc sp. C057]
MRSLHLCEIWCTGLKLVITKRIVNAHGGELSIESDTVIGTKVSVQLPLVVLGMPVNGWYF